MFNKIKGIIILLCITSIYNAQANIEINNFYIEGDWPSWTAELSGENLIFNTHDGKGEIKKGVNILSNKVMDRMILAFNSDDFYVFGFIYQVFDHYSFCGYDYESNKKQFEVLIQVDNKAFQGCALLKE